MVNKHFDLDITTRSRKYEYIVARACYYKICREIGGFTYHKIGQSVNKGHATVLHALAELPNILRMIFLWQESVKSYLTKFDFIKKKE